MRGDTSPLFSLGKMDLENVEEAVTVILEDEVLVNYPEYFLVNVTYKGNSGSGKVRVEVDGDQGLNIERCSDISRHLGKLLEERDLIKGKYLLEVTSPGADKPLKLLRQYHKHVGRRLKVSMIDGTEIEGKLLEVIGSSLCLELKDGKELQEVKLSFDEVRNSNVIVSFK